ncbi:MAG: STAS/SEC14 domain-containing protein, partial [Ignavibacteriaceae bacterium]
MIEQIQTSKKNILAIEVIDGFTETDEKLCQKLFKEKLEMGYSHINVLVKLDELKITHSSVKAFMQDTIWALRNYKSIGHLAIV